MAFCRVVFPLLVLSVISCYASNVPVIIWGDLAGSSLKENPLRTLDSKEFKDILSKGLVDVPVTVVFQEETLSVEDFSMRNADGKTAFTYLHGNIKKSDYLPSVESPLEDVHSLAEGDCAKTLRVTENGLSEDLPTEVSDSGCYIFVNFEDADADESRSELLSRHDQLMHNIVDELKARYSKVVAIYTAVNPSWVLAEPPVTHSRVRRDIAASDVHNFDYLLMKVKNISLRNKNTTFPLTTILKHNSTLNQTVLNVDLAFENVSLALNFNLKGGYWFFNSVTFENGSLVEELQPVGEEVFAIDGFSYRCAQYVKFASVNQSNDYTLNFENLKIQPFFAESNNTDFGDSFNCVGFFTAPIWAGLFVVFILLSITFYGIMMMMDIRTMDRFDDPKGKTITINASE